jgi:hypothetical protein
MAHQNLLNRPVRLAGKILRGPFIRSLLMFFLVASIGGYLAGKWNEEQQRYQAWLRQERTITALKMPVALPFEPKRKYAVGNMLKELSKNARVRIELDPQDIASGVLHANHPISTEDLLQFDKDSAPLESILWLIASRLSAQNNADPFNTFPRVVVHQERGRLILTSRSLPGEGLTTKIYSIPESTPGGIAISSQELSELLPCIVAADSWRDVGGHGSIISLPSSLVVANSQLVHEQIGIVVRQLTSLPARPATLEPVPLFPIDLPEENRIQESLDRMGTFDYQQKPFNGIVDEISQRFSIPIQLATKKLDEAAIDLKMPITFRIRNVSLRSCLKHLLRDLGLTYLIKCGCMQITTPEDACSQMSEILYPVHDLLTGGNGEEDTVADFLTSVAQESWDKTGGPGSIRTISRGWLLVWQAPETHQLLREHLALLRAEMRSSLWPATRLSPAQLAAKRILVGLEQDYHGYSQGMTFTEYFQKIQDDTDIPVLVRGRALDESRISADYCPPIDGSIQPLWRQLDAALEPSGLGFNIRDEAVLVDIRDYDRYHAEIIDVQDLTSGDNMLLSQGELCQLLVIATEPDHWTISRFRGYLVVDNGLSNVLEARSLIRYLKENRNKLPRINDVRRMKEDSAAYQVLLDEADSSSDRWRKVYLEFAVEQPFIESEP